MRPLSREVVVEKAKGGKAKTRLLAGAFSTSAVPACRHQKKRKGPFARSLQWRQKILLEEEEGSVVSSQQWWWRSKKSLSLPRAIISQACFAGPSRFNGSLHST